MCDQTLLAGLQVLAAAVKFAAAFQETQMPLLRSMQTLHAHHNAGVRRCAVAWASALIPYVATSQVSPFRFYPLPVRVQFEIWCLSFLAVGLEC